MQVDVKRARFRADSTIHDDKLASCLKLDCRGARKPLPRPSVNHSQSSPVRRSEGSPVRPSATVISGVLTPVRQSLKVASRMSLDKEDGSRVHTSTAKEKRMTRDTASVDDSDMVIDELLRRVKVDPRPRPTSHARPTNSKPVVQVPLPSSKPTSVTDAVGRTTKRGEPSTMKPRTRSVLSRSRAQKGSESASQPRTRSLAGERSGTRNASRPRRGRKPESEEERDGTGGEEDGRGRKKRRTG